nr:MAG TPA: hypothetical protein [Caudoviricetes sp.]
MFLTNIGFSNQKRLPETGSHVFYCIKQRFQPAYAAAISHLENASG